MKRFVLVISGLLARVYGKTSAALVLMALCFGPGVATAASMTTADFVALPGGGVELKFNFDGPPAAPKAYMIKKPSRLVLDVSGAENRLGARSLDVKEGLVDVVNFAESEGRLRIVTNLYEAAGYDSYVDGNSLFVVIKGASGLKAAPAAAANVVGADAGTAPVIESTRVQGVDFEREEGGVGRVTVVLSDANAGVDIVEEGNNVVVNLMGAKLPAALQQRVDVQDFVTPVMFIDTMGKGANSSILIKPSAEPYEYLAFQTDNRLILDFKPLTAQEKKERERDLFPYNGEPIDLNFQNVELRSVLQIIAEVAELNLVVSDAVGGNITLRLKNVPWDQALDIILKTRGLGQRTAGNVLLVAPIAELAKQEQQELESKQTIEELAPLRTEFIQIDYRKASEMLKTVQAAKLISERGFAMADDETNVLMVRETDAGIAEIRKTLKRFDMEVQQVLIEARLVTASTDVQKNLGVKWGFGYNDVDDGKGWILNSDVGSVNFGAPPTAAGLQVDLGANVTNPGSIAIGFKPGSSSLLALELSALESDNQVEIVSQPKVMTTNGKAAKIQSGTEIPYQTVEDNEVNIEFKEVVLSLEVTPRINPGDRIAMDLKIIQDTLGQILPTGDISIDTNQLLTSVVVPDGETIVLGGVFKNENSNVVDKVPLLGDLPGVGWLFKRKSDQINKTELLIFITPKLVRGSLVANQ
ncbi:type IV pilus secretin PilQ [Pontibacter sp. JAM-7]|uniref:type IV pilus secretin PilQ n=1 Tax=Pontibacter sp. JAM-7 TaxID=3366581 RepID=UPI003AF79802